MRYLIVILWMGAILAAIAPAQEIAPVNNSAPPVAKPDPALLRLRNQINPEFLSWSPEYVVERCAEHLATINPKDRARIRYFTLADVPRVYLPAAVSSLFFGVNQVARIPVTYVPRAVPHTDNRLFWVDLCWFGWTPEVWENITLEEPYLREPIVPSTSIGLKFLKTETKANAIIPASWFMWYVFDNGEFINQENAKVFNPKAFYYQLLYANVTFEREVTEKVGNDVKKVKKKVTGVGPATAAELEKVWHVDFNVLKDFPIDKGGLIDEGFSGVSFSNRVVWRVRTAIGVYWRTFDVFRTAGEQDFIENPFPKKFDAGEHIIQDERGAQYYFLTDGKGDAVDFANPFVVKGDPAGPHNTVLVTSRSCIHCHDSGILGFRNEHAVLQRIGADLKIITPDRAERFNQFFMQERRMKKLIKQDQDNYTEFIKDATGLTPQQNLQNFQRYRAWYGKAVDLQQGARELGVSAKELELALAIGVGTLDRPAGVTKGRLGRLVLDNHPIPRVTWERGGYAEAGLLLREWQKRGKIGLDNGDKQSRN